MYNTKYYDLEAQICAHLKRLLNSENRFHCENWEDILQQQEEKQGYIDVNMADGDWTITIEPCQ